MAIDQNAVLQYIGARYIPKFYDNPDTGDATWKSDVAYEAFTVVTYQQNSYTSKIPVPATVGNPSSNGDYWVKTADWNAQMSALQTHVSNIDNVELPEIRNNITNNDKRCFLLFGDSLSVGYTPNVPVEDRMGWKDYLKNYLTAKGYEVYIASYLPNSGFGTTNNYADLVAQTIIDQPSILNAHITDVIVYSGSNDRTATSNTELGIQRFVAAIKAHWPMADIKIGYFGAWHDLDGQNIIEIFRHCGKYGCSYIKHSGSLCCLKDKISSDGTHLTQEGYEFYAPYLADGAISGSIAFEFRLMNIPITADAGTATNFAISFIVQNDTVYEYIGGTSSDAIVDFPSSGGLSGYVTWNHFTYDYPLTLRLQLGCFASFPSFHSTDGTPLGTFELQNADYDGNITGYIYGTATDARIKIRGRKGSAYDIT